MDATTTGNKSPAAAVVVALAIGAALGGGAVWYLRDSPAEITAKQFCALGDGEGSSLLAIGAWVQAAQATADDWPAVQDEIGDRCPGWRDQIIAKGAELAP